MVVNGCFLLSRSGLIAIAEDLCTMASIILMIDSFESILEGVVPVCRPLLLSLTLMSSSFAHESIHSTDRETPTASRPEKTKNQPLSHEVAAASLPIATVNKTTHALQTMSSDKSSNSERNRIGSAELPQVRQSAPEWR